MKHSKKPNILFIVTDDQRYNTIRKLGNPEIITPNMDALARCGTSFTQAHIPGGTSGAVCMPSRAMIHTGRTLFQLEEEGQNIPVEHKTLGETLKEAGYYCYGTGKWHNGPPSFTRSFHQGDNIFFGGMWDHWNVPTCYYDPTGKYDNEINFVANFWEENKVIRQHCDRFHPGIHSTELLTDTAVSFLDEYTEDRPFFLYTAYLAPHDPRTMPDKYKELYQPENMTLPVSFQKQHFEFGVSGIRDELLAPYPRTEEEMRRQLAEYYAMITHLDDEIGKIMEALKRNQQWENTIIILTGDNGLAIGSHGLMGKQNLYEESIRIPLIFAGPGIPKGQVRDQFVYLLDIYPTLCDILGISIPPTVQGKSFEKVFGEETSVTRETLYFAYNDLIRGVKDRRYKLIQYRNVSNCTQLFDLQNNPDETENLAEEEACRLTRLRLEQILSEYKDEWGDEAHPMGRRYWLKES